MAKKNRGGIKVEPGSGNVFADLCSRTRNVTLPDGRPFDDARERRPRPLSVAENPRLVGTDGFDGAELWWIPVAHDGNQNWSVEAI